MGVLKDVLSISGQGGLFKFISQGRNGIIVESIENNKRMNASASFKISALEDIAVFTEEEEIPLEEVMKKIYDKEAGKPCINHKADNEELKSYFNSIIPDYDRERVYVSDMKKVVKWYNILINNQMLDFEAEDKKEQEAEGKEEKQHVEEKNQPSEKKDIQKNMNTTSAKDNPKSKSSSNLES